MAVVKKQRIRKVIGGVKNFLKKEQRIIKKAQITEILPHRGRMLLLDEVVITKKNIIGKFTVTEEVCQGHKFNDQLIFRGVDILEMAAQVLGIWLAQHSESQGKIAFFRRADIKSFGMIVPSDLLTIEILVEREEGEEELENPRIEMSGRPDRLIEKAIVENVIARVNKEKKAFISFIELSIVSKQGLVE